MCIRINFVDNIRIKQFILLEFFFFALFVLINVYCCFLSNKFSINVTNLYSTNGLLTYEASIVVIGPFVIFFWLSSVRQLIGILQFQIYYFALKEIFSGTFVL